MGLTQKIVALNTSGVQIPNVAQFGDSPDATNRTAQNESGLLALLHRQSFVLQSSIALPGHLMQKLLAMSGFGQDSQKLRQALGEFAKG